MPPTELPSDYIEDEALRASKALRDAKHNDEMVRIGIWLGVTAVSVGFAALVVLYLLRISDRQNYTFSPPSSLVISTIVMISSAVFMKLALRAIRRDDQAKLKANMLATVATGSLFLLIQFYSWYALAQSGVYGDDNPFAALFYVITGIHAAHLLGGLLWMFSVNSRAQRGMFTKSAHLPVYLVSVYWHVMDFSWMGFFCLLWFL